MPRNEASRATSEVVYRRRRRTALSLVIVAAVGVTTLVLAVSVGSYAIPLDRFWQVLTGQGTGFDHTVVLEWRMPRGVTALAVGACLGLSGALLQTVTRNPLASPDLIGISGGAYTAVLILLVYVGSQWELVVPAALIGALIVAAVLFLRLRWTQYSERQQVPSRWRRPRRIARRYQQLDHPVRLP